MSALPFLQSMAFNLSTELAGRCFYSETARLDFAEKLLEMAPHVRAAQRRGDTPRLRHLMAELNLMVSEATYRSTSIHQGVPPYDHIDQHAASKRYLAQGHAAHS